MHTISHQALPYYGFEIAYMLLSSALILYLNNSPRHCILTVLLGYLDCSIRVSKALVNVLLGYFSAVTIQLHQSLAILLFTRICKLFSLFLFFITHSISA